MPSIRSCADGEHIASLETFEVELPGLLDVAASIERFRRWGDDLIDRWDGETMLRVLHLPSGETPFAAQSLGTLERPRLRVQLPVGVDRAAASGEIETMFVQADIGRLAATDPAVAAANERFPGHRPVLERDPLTALVRSVSAQQINLTFAATVRRRLVQAFGRRHAIGEHEVWSLDVEQLAGAGVAAIRELQFTTRKAEYIIGIAQRIAADPLHFAELAAVPDEEVLRRLTAMPGIGRWSAEWYLARTLGRPVVAAGDLGVRKAIGKAYFEGRMPSEQEVRQATAHWSDAAGVAQQLLLEYLNAKPSTGSSLSA
ncbi:MAG: DNA-3-methyladenine glycosylase family protein [Chloroflexota bacterium]